MKELIKLFKVAVNTDAEKLDVIEVNNFASRLGYMVHPDACTQDVMDFLEDQKLNLDSTFYKTWQDVTSKSRFELFIDQIIHYTMSYGMNEAWTPKGECLIPNIDTYKVILPCTEEEMFDKCMKMLQSGIALKLSTINTLVNYIDIYSSKNDINIDIDSIKNREALVALCDRLNITPKNKFNLIRYIYFKTTGNTLMVNNFQNFTTLSSKWLNSNFKFSDLSEEQLRGLASIFFRFKYIFLGLRKRAITRLKDKNYNDDNFFIDKDNVAIINKLRRMADKYHQPMKIGYWESILSTPEAFPYITLRKKVKEVSNFKIITLLQTIQERKSIIGGMGPNLYVIRNGKVFIKESEANIIDRKYDYWDDLYKILYNQLVENLSAKACNIKFPKNLILACPTSEKNFIGDIPFGSYFDMKSHDNVIGIYWEGKNGCRDLDLSFCDYKGNKIGWNARYYNKEGIIYSGDMVIADPCATELLYTPHNCPNGYINVNLFSGQNGGLYKFFLAQEKIDTSKNIKNYMINPNHIKLTTEIEATGQQTVGVVCDNRLYIMSFTAGQGRVSQVSKNDDLDKIFKRKAISSINLKTLLMDAGFKEIKKETEENPIDIDLTDLKRDTLIELFS